MRSLLSAGLAAALCGAAASHAATTHEWKLDAALHSVPPGVPDVVVVKPEQPPGRVVVYLHGWEACARGVASSGRVDCGHGVQVDGHAVADRVGKGSPDAALVIPQLRLLHRGGDPGTWRRHDQPAAWRDELESKAGLGSAWNHLTVVAHSGGYLAAAALLRAEPSINVDTVVLLDALYGEVDTFAAWLCAQPGRVLVSLHTAHAGITRRNGELAHKVRTCHGDSAVQLATGLPPNNIGATPLLVVRTRVPHGALPADRLAPILAGLVQTSAVGGTR